MTMSPMAVLARYRLLRWLALSLFAIALNSLAPLKAFTQNTPPVLQINAGLTLNEGSAAIISSSLLLVTDAEQGPDQLTFTVATGPTNGMLSPATGFTQQDIDNDLVTYTHDGGETTSDNFTFTVSDGAGGAISTTMFFVTVTPVNDPPVLVVNGGLTVDEGATATINTTDLQVTDAEQGPDQLTFTVATGPTNGMLSPATGFTQQDIDNNLVTYTHDGGETTSDNFTFTVSDGAGGTISTTMFFVTVTPVNDPPVLVVNGGLTVDEGATATINTTDLQVTDAEQGPDQLTFTVATGPTNGMLSPATGFTQQDIDNDLVTYTHDGGETTSDNFTFTVSDGAGGTISTTMFFVTVTPVNDPPVLVVNGGLTVDEGATATINTTDLQVTDAEQGPDQLTFTVATGPTNGMLSPATGFTQQDIDNNLVTYTHDGGETTSDNFTFTVSDGAGGTISTTMFFVTVTPVNDPPVITSVLDVGNDQGRSVLITFQKSDADTAGSPTPVLEYAAFRRIDPLPLADSGAGDGAPALEGWVYAGSIPANCESIYNIVAPTLADSTVGGGMHWSVFFIRALTADPPIYFDSAPDSGYSVDNLAPGVPLNLAFDAPEILTWDDVTDADFDFYTIYGSSSAIFDETADVVGHTTAPTFDVHGQLHTYFFVSATDFNGNEGDPASIPNPTGVTGPPLVQKTSLSAHPNPFNPATTIVYTVEEAGPVTVAVYNTAGTLVEKLVDNEYREPSEYRIEYRPRGASGVYFVRLESSRHIRNAKLVLLK